VSPTFEHSLPGRGCFRRRDILTNRELPSPYPRFIVSFCWGSAVASRAADSMRYGRWLRWSDEWVWIRVLILDDPHGIRSLGGR
jgi:hypothetical protein